MMHTMELLRGLEKSCTKCMCHLIFILLVTNFLVSIVADEEEFTTTSTTPEPDDDGPEGWVHARLVCMKDHGFKTKAHLADMERKKDHKAMCVSFCVGRHMKVVDVYGEVDRDAIMKYKGKYRNIVAYCVDEDEQRHVKDRCERVYLFKTCIVTRVRKSRHEEKRDVTPEFIHN